MFCCFCRQWRHFHLCQHLNWLYVYTYSVQRYKLCKLTILLEVDSLAALLWLFTVNFLLFYLSVNQAANDCDLEHIAYEFFTQAFVLYEEEIAVSSMWRNL